MTFSLRRIRGVVSDGRLDGPLRSSERTGLVALYSARGGVTLRTPITRPLVCRLIVANLTAMLAWWAENGMTETAAEMQPLFQSCVGPMVEWWCARVRISCRCKPDSQTAVAAHAHHPPTVFRQGCGTERRFMRASLGGPSAAGKLVALTPEIRFSGALGLKSVRCLMPVPPQPARERAPAVGGVGRLSHLRNRRAKFVPRPLL